MKTPDGILLREQKKKVLPYQPRTVAVWGLVAIVAIALPLVISDQYLQNIMILTLMFAVLGQAWNIIGGYGGQIAFGNAAFFGVGAYVSTLMWIDLGISPWIGMLAAGVVCGVVAVAIGYPCLRTSGLYFAIATLGLGEVMRTIFLNWDFVRGAVGIEIPIRPDSWIAMEFNTTKVPYYYILLVGLVLTFLLVRWIERSKFGYYLLTIKASETAAKGVGINITQYKLRAFVISAAITGMVGTFYAQYLLYIDPLAVMPMATSVRVALIAVLGGTATVMGPLLGAVILVPASELLRGYLGGSGSGFDMAFYGIVIMVITVREPGGLMAVVRRIVARRKEAKVETP